MATKKLFFLFSILLSMVGIKALAYDIAVENADGVTIYYNYINDGKELEVTYKTEFYDSYSGSVVIPVEVTYMNRALKVTSIGDRAFLYCRDLISVTIPTSVTSIGNEVFSYCSSLPSITIPNSVTSIGDYAFKCCYELTSITIPNSVTSIGKEAFYACRGLTSVTIGNSVTSIGQKAFIDCSGLTSVNISDIAAWFNITFADKFSNPLNCAEHFFLNGVEIEDLVIPNGVTSIGGWAFIGCKSMTSVTIGNSVTSIENCAFFGCRGLISVTIGNSVTSIGKEAFLDCRGLTSITIGNSVTSIGNYAFGDCYYISEVILKIENPFNIENEVFTDNTFCNATLYVPTGATDKYKATDGWNKFVFIEEGSPSSISAIDNTGAYEYKRYTLDGRVINNSHKGINIIQMDNGITKKVLIKR